MKNFKQDIKEIGTVLRVFIVVGAVIMFVGWLIKLLFN